MMVKALRVATANTEAEAGAPPPERIISGDPRFTTWNIEDNGRGLYAGVWEATPGKWVISYEEWEYFRVISGLSIVTEEGGEPVRYGPSDAGIIRPGFRGTWEVVETTRKDYVISI
jgi:uncharacterized protein